MISKIESTSAVIIPKKTFPDRIDLPEIADLLANHIIPAHSEGITFDPRRKRPVSFRGKVFLVSLFGFERQFEQLPDCGDVLTWLGQTNDLLQDRDKFIGFYYSDKHNRFFLDVSVPWFGRHTAMQVAAVNRQREIYCPATDKLIPVHTRRWYARLARVIVYEGLRLPEQQGASFGAEDACDGH